MADASGAAETSRELVVPDWALLGERLSDVRQDVVQYLEAANPATGVSTGLADVIEGLDIALDGLDQVQQQPVAEEEIPVPGEDEPDAAVIALGTVAGQAATLSSAQPSSVSESPEGNLTLAADEDPKEENEVEPEDEYPRDMSPAQFKELTASLSGFVNGILLSQQSSDRRKLDQLTGEIISAYREAAGLPPFREVEISPEAAGHSSLDASIENAIKFALRASAEARTDTELQSGLEVLVEELEGLEDPLIDLATTVLGNSKSPTAKLTLLAVQVWAFDQLPPEEADEIAPSSFLRFRQRISDEA